MEREGLGRELGTTLGGRLLLLASLYVVTGSIELSVSSCFNTTRKTLMMTCPQGHMVRVTRMLQGTNTDDRCEYSTGDCIHEIRHDTVPCMGRDVCEVNLPSGDTGTELHACRSHATYLQVHYTCVNASSVSDICEVERLTDQSGYISTPWYPSNYPAKSHNCTLQIMTPFRQQKLTIYAIDMHLEATDSGCADLIYLYDGHHSFTSCATTSRTQLMLTMENHVLIRFESNAVNREKGFWLYYNASPHFNVTTPAPTTTTTTTTTTTIATITTTRSTTTSQSADGHLTSDGPQKSAYDVHETFSVGLVVGILIGILICIMCVVLLILYLKRRQRQMSQSVIGRNSSIAAMASTLEKPVPTQTFNNLQYPQDKPPKPRDMDITETDKKFDKTKYLSPFIESDLSTGEEQLVC